MKKGFTLIELLAVIVILAIIAIIATPIVLDIINDTKENAILRSAEFYLKEIETAITTSMLKGKTISDGIYTVMEDGNLCIETLPSDKCKGDILQIEVKGTKPSSGTVEIVSGSIKNIELILSEKRVIKNDKGEVIHFPCILKRENKNTPGSLYECEVKPGEKYNFYVLSQEEDGTKPINNTSGIYGYWIFDAFSYDTAGGVRCDGILYERPTSYKLGVRPVINLKL